MTFFCWGREGGGGNRGSFCHRRHAPALPSSHETATPALCVGCCLAALSPAPALAAPSRHMANESREGSENLRESSVMRVLRVLSSSPSPAPKTPSGTRTPHRQIHGRNRQIQGVQPRCDAHGNTFTYLRRRDMYVVALRMAVSFASTSAKCSALICMQKQTKAKMHFTAKRVFPEYNKHSPV